MEVGLISNHESCARSWLLFEICAPKKGVDERIFLANYIRKIVLGLKMAQWARLTNRD